MAELTQIPDAIGVGFGTAALGENNYNVVRMALDAGFRKIDSAEADVWYDQQATGAAIRDFIEADPKRTCAGEDLQITTKIPPWSLTSIAEIRSHAAASREELVGFCEDVVVGDGETCPYPLDVYFIHNPKCFDGWHHRCKGAPEALPLQKAWMAMEAAAGIDHSSKRIGLSNVGAEELLGIIRFVKDRQESGSKYPPPRMPDAVQNFADPLSQAKEVRQICKEHGIEFVSYSTLGAQHRDYPENPVLTSPIVLDMSKRYGRSTAEVVLSWALQRDMSVIPRSQNPTHISELANLLTEPTFLDDADLLAIDGMGLN